MVTQMIGVGEQTGAMDAMLQKIADFYEDEVDAAVKDLLTAMEPIMIVVLGIVVGGIVISMYLPLFSLDRQVGGTLDSCLRLARGPGDAPRSARTGLGETEPAMPYTQRRSRERDHESNSTESLAPNVIIGEWLPWLGRVRFLAITFLVGIIIAARHLTPAAISLRSFVQLAGFVVHPGDFLRDSAALDSEGALARSAANFLRSADDHRSGLHHRRSGQLFRVACICWPF